MIRKRHGNGCARNYNGTHHSKNEVFSCQIIDIAIS